MSSRQLAQKTKAGFCVRVRSSCIWALALTTTTVAACHGEPAESPPQTNAYSIAIVASVPAALPKCTSLLSGTTALVQMPISLYSCVANIWVPIRARPRSPAPSPTQARTRLCWRAYPPSGRRSPYPGRDGPAGNPRTARSRWAAGSDGCHRRDGRNRCNRRDGCNRCHRRDGRDGRDGRNRRHRRDGCNRRDGCHGSHGSHGSTGPSLAD